MKIGWKDEARFWANVDQRDPNECWPWRGWRDERGYGRISIDGRNQGAHRVSYQLANGDLPAWVKKDRGPSWKGLVMHECDNPSCVNPKHLSLGSPQDNSNDMVAKRRFMICKGRAKLTPDMVREIRSEALPDERLYALALKFSVSPTTIIQAHARKTWRDVE